MDLVAVFGPIFCGGGNLLHKVPLGGCLCNSTWPAATPACSRRRRSTRGAHSGRLGSPPGGLTQPPLAAVCLLGRKARLHPLKQLLRGSTDSLRQRAGSGGAGSPLLLRKQLQIHCPGVFSPVPCACTRAPGPSGRHPWVPRAQHFVALPTSPDDYPLPDIQALVGAGTGK